jgi:hypothetical protein
MSIKKYTGIFCNNDSDDEVLRELVKDDVYIETRHIIAFYPSKYPGFIKVELTSGSTFCIRETTKELWYQLGM